ncbi:MAG: CNNM domain-containing protein [Candidatus Neomarinimicrobiota bacterium]|nr:CNNM domain-containing protein [Candidatus Neomarinimicrobiota bacterium]
MTALIIYFLAALLISFLCSLLESALLSLSIAHVSVMEKEGRKGGQVLVELKQNINRPLAAILTINTIANTVGAVGVGAQTMYVFGNKWVAVSSGILTLSILIFSEIIPKTIGAVYSKSLASFTAFTVRGLMAIAWPFVILSEFMSSFINRGENGGESKASREELLAMAEISEDEGSIDEQEGDIIENLIKLDDILVEEVMTPKSVVFALSKDQTVGEVVEQHSPIVFSRIPVYENELDQIIGLVNRYTLVNKQAEDQFHIKMSDLMKPIHTVSEKESISDVLDKFVKRRQQIFMVSDEFGTTTGLITLEDAIETLLGVEIVDEHDHVVDMRKLAAAKMREKSL